MTRRIQPNDRRAAMMALIMVASLLVAVFAAAPPAHAIDHGKGSPGYCPDADGVTVIIDFQELGGDLIIRCAPGDQETGHAALKNAGIEIAGTNRWGEAFICRIEGKPGPDAEPCIDTPPATAYWSYWHASNGGEWEYSQWGVMNRKPPPGSFEGWSFSKDKTEETNPPPRMDPVRPANDDPDDGTTAPAGPGNDAGPGNGPEPDEATSQPDDDPDDTDDGDSEAPPGPDDLPSEAPGWTGVGEDGMQTASSQTEEGMPASTIAGLTAIGLLALGALVAAWRRRAPAVDDAA